MSIDRASGARVLVRLDIPPQRCVCGYEFECCSEAPAGGEPSRIVPEVGSVAVCFECGRVYVFDADLTVQPITLDHLPIDERREVRKIVDLIHKFRGIPS